MGLDIRDWLIIVLVAFIMATATTYLFAHPLPSTFGTWGGVVATVSGLYHWLIVKDSKTPDAPQDIHP